MVVCIRLTSTAKAPLPWRGTYGTARFRFGSPSSLSRSVAADDTRDTAEVPEAAEVARFVVAEAAEALRFAAADEAEALRFDVALASLSASRTQPFSLHISAMFSLNILTDLSPMFCMMYKVVRVGSKGDCEEERKRQTRHICRASRPRGVETEIHMERGRHKRTQKRRKEEENEKEKEGERQTQTERITDRHEQTETVRAIEIERQTWLRTGHDHTSLSASHFWTSAQT